MVLILTNSRDATVDYLDPILGANGIRVCRLDTDHLTQQTLLEYRANTPRLKLDTQWIAADEVAHVWYRRPEKLCDERFDGSAEGRYTLSEWAESLEGFFAHIPRHRWMNHPAANTLASHKIEQLTTAVALGFNVPATLVTQDKVELRAFVDHHDGRVIIKPMATGYVDRGGDQSSSLIYTNPINDVDLANLDDLTVCPTLFQAFIERHYDVRITVVDDKVHAVAMHIDEQTQGQKYDIRRDNMSRVIYRSVDLPDEIRERVVSLKEHYGLRFAAVDMAKTSDGNWVFFEINPNGQWAWLDLCAGMKIADSFVESFSVGNEQRSPFSYEA